MSGFSPEASILSFYIASINVTVDVLGDVRVTLLVIVLALCSRRLPRRPAGQRGRRAVVHQPSSGPAITQRGTLPRRGVRETTVSRFSG